MLPCNLTDGTFASMMELSSPQKETKETVSEETDLRGGGLPCLDESSVWRSWNKAGMGDVLKSPKMGVRATLLSSSQRPKNLLLAIAPGQILH